MSNLKFCQGPDCHTYTYTRTDLKDLKIIRLIKLEEDHICIMVVEIFATCKDVMYDWVAQYIDQGSRSLWKNNRNKTFNGRKCMD